jgi:hypothetical protein
MPLRLHSHTRAICVAHRPDLETPASRKSLIPSDVRTTVVEPVESHCTDKLSSIVENLVPSVTRCVINRYCSLFLCFVQS